ncbi:hypothetical protein C8J56DRAFT_945883 [Mycena floridula]|nr:hypothetical protein C8J56DRAFT_945883 [Mycena floridula]
MFSAKFIITVFSAFVSVSAAPGPEALGLQRKQASPTITLCIGSVSPPTSCITIPVVSGSCMNLSGGLSPLNKQISGVQVPFVCTFFQDFGCVSGRDVAVLPAGTWDMAHVGGGGTQNFDNLTSSISC